MNAVSQPEPEPEAERAYGQCEENEDCCFSQLGVGCFYPRLNILGVKLCIAPTDAYVTLSLFHAKRKRGCQCHERNHLPPFARPLA